MELGLAGRRTIVTGASKGIGAATAVALAAEGARCGLIARDAAALANVSERILAAGGAEPVVAVADLSTAEGVIAGIDTCTRSMGGVDVLVNNAGASPIGSFDAIDDATWQASFDLKLMGYVRCMRAVLPHMRAQGSGRIVNVGGAAGLRASGGYVLAAVNAAIVHITQSTAEHVGPDGIGVVCVHPGPTLTERLLTMLAPAAAAAHVEPEAYAHEVMSGQLPLRRLGTPEEVARMIVVMCSDVAAWTTAGGVSIDGGASRGL